MECKSLRDSGAELRKFQVALFAASTDTPETNRKFAESLKLDYPILSDPECTAGKAYGVLIPILRIPKRWTFIIDKDGVLRHLERNVDVRGHGKQLAKKLEELGVPLREKESGPKDEKPDGEEMRKK
ncbi:MAG: redoxin domain-containing protein [Planctomycetes bacterium]|nr:redoxin domain-containing protein [Planctomycetota bacterium]